MILGPGRQVIIEEVSGSGGEARGFLRGSSVSSSGTGPDTGFSGSGSRGGTGIVSGGEGGMESVVCRARGAVDSQVPAPRSSVNPSRTGKRRRDTATQVGHQSRPKRRRGEDNTTVHTAQYINTAHDRHKGSIQPTQRTYCTTGQAHCTVVGMEIIQSNQI